MSLKSCFAVNWRQHMPGRTGTPCQRCPASGRCKSLTLHNGEEVMLEMIEQLVASKELPERKIGTNGALAEYVLGTSWSGAASPAGGDINV